MWSEYEVGPVSVRSSEVITALKCDLRRELVWAGCESGYLYVMHRQLGEVMRYSSWRAQSTRVVALLPLGSHMLSLAHNRVAMHSAGGLLQFACTAKDGLHITSGLLEAGQGLTRLLLGGVANQAGVVASFDLAAHEECARWEVEEASPVAAVKGPVSRGLVAVATVNGQLCLADPRSKMAVVNKLAAHPGGIRSMDARGDLIATVGCGLRLGEVVVDNMVKVFDVRKALRPILTLPASNPRLLQFQPRRVSTVLVASASGIVTFTDVQNAAIVETHRVNLAGYGSETLTAADISTSGDIAVLGGSGGSLHIWRNGPQAVMNLNSDPLEIVPMYPSLRRRSLPDHDSFASLPQYYSHDPWLLSELDSNSVMEVGLPPHALDPLLLRDMNQVDFVGFVPNPFYMRGLPPLSATRAVAHLRNSRLQLRAANKKGQEALKAERAMARAAAGGTVLPMKYHRMEIKVQTGVKFEEFDFSYYNRTCFAGLENGLRNCYVNSLLQVLYFVPMFRKLLLSHVPEPAVEFCLTCEMSFLFRMLRSSNGTPCQAANLLRTLKQIPEAAALGLLEGSTGPGQDSPQTRSLPRLLAFLTRFLLDHLNKENGAGGARHGRPTSGCEIPSGIDAIFGLRYRQCVQCSDSDLPAKIREASNFQVDLVVPSRESPCSCPPTPERSSLNYLKARDAPPLTPPGTICPNRLEPPAPWDGRPRSAGDIWTFPCALSSPQHPPAAHATTTPPPGASPQMPHPSHPSTSPLGPHVPPSEDHTPRASRQSTPASRSQRAFRPEPLDVSTRAHSYPPSPRGAYFPPSNATPGHKPLQSRPPHFQTFSELLQASLQQSTETRAWFQETRSYHAVMQSRVPLKMPQVLVVNCSSADPLQLQLWMKERSNDPDTPSWLPPAIAVESSPADWQVIVQEGDSSTDLQQEPAPGNLQVVYELTAVVCHVLDADDVADPTGSSPPGHLIAHIKVLPPYVIEQQELEANWMRPHQHTLSSCHVPEPGFRGRQPPPAAHSAGAGSGAGLQTYPVGGPRLHPSYPAGATPAASPQGVAVKEPAQQRMRDAATTTTGAGPATPTAGDATAANTTAATVVATVATNIVCNAATCTSPTAANPAIPATPSAPTAATPATAASPDAADMVTPHSLHSTAEASSLAALQQGGATDYSTQTELSAGDSHSTKQGTEHATTANAVHAKASGAAVDGPSGTLSTASSLPQAAESHEAPGNAEAPEAPNAPKVAAAAAPGLLQAGLPHVVSDARTSDNGSAEEPLLSVRRSTESLPTTLSPCSALLISPSRSPHPKLARPAAGDRGPGAAGESGPGAVGESGPGAAQSLMSCTTVAGTRQAADSHGEVAASHGAFDSSGDVASTAGGSGEAARAGDRGEMQLSSTAGIEVGDLGVKLAGGEPLGTQLQDGQQGQQKQVPSQDAPAQQGKSQPRGQLGQSQQGLQEQPQQQGQPQSLGQSPPHQHAHPQAQPLQPHAQSHPLTGRTSTPSPLGMAPWTPLPSPASAQAMTTAIKAALTTPTSSRTQGACSQWLVFNDFCISPSPFQEVMNHFDGQKLPVLLFYTQVEELEAAEEERLSAPVPVLTPDMFHQLCHAEPLQGPSARISPRAITPFDVHTNPPRPGMLLALDAEFVALSAPVVQLGSDGTEVQVRQSRLGLARVSVLYGEGELAGVPCIDDYIRTLEPVYDYLTRFSGLAAGDLDPSSSPHPLCTLKAAYLKLRFLVDAGCVFVGHGLKKDFRTINIVVPPCQIIDTVELYSFRRHRKLSLRFLASYMLGVNIQEETHDSVEDARTALQLYQVYCQLEAEGRVMEVLTGIYQWGKQHGWEPPTRNSANSNNNGSTAADSSMQTSSTPFLPPAASPAPLSGTAIVPSWGQS